MGTDRGRTGFHAGELTVQRRAGVAAQAARLAGMVGEPNLDGGARRFLGERTLAVLSARDQDGLLWSSPLLGPAGFLRSHGRTLEVHNAPGAGDPLASLPAGQPVGWLAIDFATRRRMRVNGFLVGADDGRLEISVDQAYVNCPKYIHQRHIALAAVAGTGTQGVLVGTRLTLAQTKVIRDADTFFLGTTHPVRGNDASHRGGPAGFVRAETGALWWPDYPGNNMFNSLGNLAVDPTASLLFVDFGTGQTLHLSGRARTEWARPGSAGDRLDFAEANLVACAESTGIGRVVSFDRSIDRVSTIERVEP